MTSYVQINSFCDSWAKDIIFGKHNRLLESGVDSYVFWGHGEHEQDSHMQCIQSTFGRYVDALQTRIDGRVGFHSKRSTQSFLELLDTIEPDTVHLHSLIGYYINIEMLFNWLASRDCRVVWTLHDCWAFTGHCLHFTYVGCEQWRTCCEAQYICPQTKVYVKTYKVGGVKKSFEEKRRLFTMLPRERLSLITPSEWLKGLVEDSFLSKYDVVVERNEIDHSIFRPITSDFRSKYNIGNRRIILCVASRWTNRKGLDDVIRLAGDLDSREAVVVVIGLNHKQLRQLQTTIIALPKMNSAKELAEAYTAADVLFNPTKEDNYPTVNLESEACGTPVVTYDTGGSRETISLQESIAIQDYNAAKMYIFSLLGIGGIERTKF